MSSRGSWRLGIVILVLALAVVFSLNLDFPEWVEEMLFWRTAGQRQVELRYGSELEEGLQIKLLPSFGYQPDAATFESARQVLQDRLAGHEPAGASVEVLGDGILLVELQGIRERVWLTDTLQSIGLIEFIDASLRRASSRPSRAPTPATTSALRSTSWSSPVPSCRTLGLRAWSICPAFA
jgi:hypothetical protein